MFHSNDTDSWSWLVDELATALRRQPAPTRDRIVARLDREAGYALNPEDAKLIPQQAHRRNLVDGLISRLDRTDQTSGGGRTLLLNEKFAKSVTLA